MNAIRGHRRARAEMEALQQLKTRHGFKNDEDGLLVDRARCDLRIATLARLQIEFEARGLLPETPVVEGRKPLLDFLHVNKRFHPAIVPNGSPQLQISANS